MTGRILAGALALAVVAGPAGAGWLANSLADGDFDNSDYQAARDAGATLYDGVDPALGAMAEWANAETGSTGTVEITEIGEGPCIRLHHIATIAAKGKTVEANGRRCQGDDGRWLIAPEQ
ncbi:MAG: hypothetical protein AAF713_06450 [Pseudomonadota bacterium]